MNEVDTTMLVGEDEYERTKAIIVLLLLLLLLLVVLFLFSRC